VKYLTEYVTGTRKLLGRKLKGNEKGNKNRWHEGILTKVSHAKCHKTPHRRQVALGVQLKKNFSAKKICLSSLLALTLKQRPLTKQTEFKTWQLR
jgi:hypothetical protein